MNLKELNELNKKASFKDFRLKFPKQLLLALTLGGTIIVALWQFFDGMYGIHQSKVLFQLRGLTLAALLLNLIIGLIRANDNAYKQHIILGFYTGTLFCTLLALLTGAGQSPYWYGLFFVLIGWFILLPFSYTVLTFNGLAFVAIFTGVIFTQHKDLIDAQIYFRIFSIYSGILMVGWIAAINRNKADAENFLSSIKIQEANEELQAVVEELRAEVESHHETTCQLQEKQQLLDSILENAPIVIWSIDLEGNFTYTQGKALENIGVKPGDNIGKSVFDVYKDTEAEFFVKKVLEGTIEQDIVKVKNLLYDTRVSPLYNLNGEKYGYIGVAMDVTEQKKAETNLKKFRLVLDQVPAAAYIIDKNMYFEYVNAEFAKQSGYSVEDLLHKHVNETIYKGEIPESRRYIAEALLRGESWQGELYSRHKSGRMYWANTIASPYNDEAGNVDGYIIIQQDVTDQKQMELDLIESETLYRSLIENTLDSVVLTQDYKFIYVNEVFLKLMGYTHEELLNIEPTSIIAPEDRERVMEYHAKRINGEVRAQSYIATFVRKDGSRFIAEMNSSTVFIKGKNSSLVTLRDITEREKLQQALLESELQYRNVVEQAIDGITITQDRNLIFANKAFCDILEYSIEEIVGMPVMQAVSDGDMDDMNDMFRRIESGEKFSRYTIWNAITKSGKIKTVELHVAVIEYKGKPAFLVITRDITERLKMEQAVRESEAKYKTLVENSQDCITIIRDNKFLFANDTYCKMLGYTREELYNMPSVATLHPSEYEKAYKIAKRRHENDFSVINEVMLMLTKDGQVRECETTSTLIQYQGEWASFFTSHDITESKRMQLAIQENEEKYRLLFEAESDAIFMIDVENGDILDTNPAASRIYGYSKEEFLKMKNTDVSAEPDKTRTATLNNEKIVPIRYHKRKDGVVIPVELSAGFAILNERKIQIVTSRDITERVQNQEALRKSEKRFRELTEMLPQAVYELDTNGRPTFMNKTGREMFKMDGLSSSGKMAFEYFSSEDRQRMLEALEIETKNIEIVDGEIKAHPSRPMEYTAFRSDGTSFPVIIYGAPIFEDGRVTGSRGIIVDISERKAMENALRESEKKFRELADFMPQTIFELDKNMCLVYMNRSGMEAFGLTEADYGKSCLDSFESADKEIVANNLYTTMEGNRKKPMYEYVAKSRSGRKFPVLIYSLPVYNNGEVCGTRGMAIDISERKAAEQALKESEEKYRSLIENANDGVIITQNGLLKYVNPAMCEMMGYSSDELVEQPFLNFVPEENHQVMVDFHKRRMTGENFNALYRSKIIQKKGNIINIELNARTLIYNNQPAAFIIIRDISEREIMENALRESEEKYRELVETTNSIILKWNNKFEITFLNEYGLNFFGYQREEIIGKPIVGTIVSTSEQFTGRDLNELMKEIFKAPEKYAHNINENTCKNGEKVWISWNNTAIKNLEGEVTDMFSVGTDITERRKNEEELRITKEKLQELNQNLEIQVDEAVKKLTEANTQLIRLQKENLQSQFEVLRQQVNPHFLFNSLNVLTSLIKLEPDLAEKFTEHLSKVYRYVLENKDNDLVSLQTELDFLDAYLFLLNIRFMDKIKVEINIELDRKAYLILPLALQLIIENAIKHNTMSKKAPLVIQIFADHQLMLNIVNNLQERESHMASTGVGLKNIAHRYHLLELPAPQFEKTETHFIAKIPLKKMDQIV